ncbi:Beta-Casp domain-containing protein [Rozella allomycis CSF55]|uniref:Cleavage and polyadenylation specificity factor subunit 2 n=1 Tax=Rozella allomycis (strain CSF55) TaxID=988480 RepID=A0A075AQM7_ROZAC|nr:Beta-Casp domain-containing protein [Rozella allomycis CSF55]|eukprot:EPZ32528.1 Beta-Casp domain-containing protein [Rozella allomycis CSF55]
MTSFVKFTPISGAFGDEPLCYLLEIDQQKILLDCGCDPAFEVLPDLLSRITKLTKTIDVILLSHSNLEYLGGLVYVYKEMALHCPIYATIPIMNFGPLTIQEALRAKCLDGPFSYFSMGDIMPVFEKCIGLRYLQNITLPGIVRGIHAVPYNAGHSLGACIWRLRKDTDDIVYAVGYNHRKEKYVNEASLDAISRPTLLITDSKHSLSSTNPRKQREGELFGICVKVLDNHGTVIIPVDTCSRSLELIYTFEQYWQNNKLDKPIFFLSSCSQKVIEYAKSTIEWMSENVKRSFENSRENPFNLKNIKLISSMEELRDYRGGKIILATSESLENGFSRDLLVEFGKDKKNCLILPFKLSNSKFYSQILKFAETKNREASIQISYQKEDDLVGEELESFLREEIERKRKEEEEEEYKKQLEAASDGEESDDESTNDKKRARLAEIEQERYWTLTQFDLNVKDASFGGDFFKKSFTHQMFPYFEKRLKFDDYGESIQAEDYLTADDLEERRRAIEKERRLNQLKEDEPQKSQRPKKWVGYDFTLHLRLYMRAIDFGGYADGRSIKNILTHISPKKIILIGGSPEATTALAQYCNFSNDITNDVISPKLLEVVNVSSNTNIYQIKLTDAILSSLQFEKLASYELSFINGIVGKKSEEDTSTVPTLDIISDQSKVADVRQPIFIGDVKLSEFRKLCNQSGLMTQFYKGDLVCNDSVIDSTGKLTIEGNLTDAYYKVRNLLYRQHAII